MAHNRDVAIHHASVGEGYPVVMLHGFSDSLESWDALGYVAPLVAVGHRAMLVDARGHGASGRPHDPAAYAADLRAGDVIGVLDALACSAPASSDTRWGWTALNLAHFHRGQIDRLVVGGVHPFGQSMTFYRGAVSDWPEKWLAILERLGGELDPEFRARIEANDVVALQVAVADDRPDISRVLGASTAIASPMPAPRTRCLTQWPVARISFPTEDSSACQAATT